MSMGAPLACGVINGCQVVTTSEYAYIFGIPIAALGVGFYLTMLILSFRSGRDASAVSYMVVLSVAGLLFTAYLTYLQFFVIEATCFWCISSAVIVTLLFIVSLLFYRTTVNRGHGDRVFKVDRIKKT